MKLVSKKLFPYKRLFETRSWLEGQIPKPETTYTRPIAEEILADFESVAGQLNEESFSEALGSIGLQAI